MNRIMKKLVPGVLAAALALGAVPSGLSFDDIAVSADGGYTGPYIVGYGGVVTTVVETKIQFYADGRVGKVTLTDPDDGSVVEVKPANGSTDNYISCPIYPKNMHKTISVRMYDHDGNPMQFKVNPEATDTVPEFEYTFNDYLNGLQTQYQNKKATAPKTITNLDIATYDFSRALENYGEWTRYYFYHSNEPEDGKYVEYTTNSTYFGQEGYTPHYPSWWTNKVKVGEEEDKYWEADIDSSLGGKTFNQLLDQFHQPVTSLRDSNSAGLTEAEKLAHQYAAALVLDEGVRVRCYFKNRWTPGLIINDIDDNSRSIGYSSFQPLSDSDYKYVDTELISFGNLKNKICFTFSGMWSNYTDVDKVTISPLGYAKVIAIDLAKTKTGYEQSGLANAMRAMVTVETTAYLYNHPDALTPAEQEPDNSGS